MLVQSMADSYMSDCMGKAFYCRLLGKSFSTFTITRIWFVLYMARNPYRVLRTSTVDPVLVRVSIKNYLGYGIGTIAVAAIFANLLHWRATKPKNQTR